MEDKYFNTHIDKADLSSSIDIPKEEEEKFLKALANPPETNERLKKLFESLSAEDKQKLKDFIEKNYNYLLNCIDNKESYSR